MINLVLNRQDTILKLLPILNESCIGKDLKMFEIISKRSIVAGKRSPHRAGREEINQNPEE